MDRLELRFYSRKEISEATGRKLGSDQFKRDVLHDLDAWGYEYIWHNRNGVTITGRLESNELRLKELLVEHLELDTQVDPVEFAQFIAAFWTVEGFCTMTTKIQSQILSELCGRDISESTITRWRGKLFKSGNAHKFGKAALWKTTTENGIKRQQRVDVNSPEYDEYCKARTATLKAIKESDSKKGPSNTNDSVWGRMVMALYPVYGVYYYCPEICLDAFGDAAEEITELVYAIMEEKNK